MEEQDQDQTENHGEQRTWSSARLVGLVLIILAGLVTLYSLVGYVAWQSGQTIRKEREETQQAEQLARQVDLAQDNIGQGSYSLALRRLDWVLQHDPDNKDAQAVRQQADAALKTALTPVAPPSPTPPPEPSPTPVDISRPETEFERLRRLAKQEKWENLFESTLVFQQQYPGYERLQTDTLLYDSSFNLGLSYIQGDQIEAGIYYLAQAEKLGDLPQEALDYWLWAELYLQGMAYYGVNWGVAAGFFRDLCLSAPFYQGSCDKLFDALFAYGNQYLVAQDYCPAAQLFREARQHKRNQDLDLKLNEAVQGCAQATPTPATITGTLPVTGRESLATPVSNE
jgi:hypothetical protein